MYCLTCDAEKHPVQAFTAKGFVDKCPTCETVFARLDALTDHEDGAPQETPPAPKPAVAPARPIVVPSEPETGDALIARMRTRLAYVESEIAARAKFDAERDMLRRMLASVGEEPLSVSLTN